MKEAKAIIELTLHDPLDICDAENPNFQQEWLNENVLKIAQQLAGSTMVPYEGSYQVKLLTRVTLDKQNGVCPHCEDSR